MAAREKQSLKENDEKVFGALCCLYSKKRDQRAEYSETGKRDIWIETRRIAEDCDMNIYKTRYVLLKLCTQGLAEQLPTIRGGKCSWKPVLLPE